MSDPRRRPLPRPGRLIRWAFAALVLALVAAGLGGYLYKRDRTGSIYHPHARFIPQPTPTLPTRGPERFAWPLYGYTPEHTRFFPAPAACPPPFRGLWVHNGHALLEFPPVHLRRTHLPARRQRRPARARQAHRACRCGAATLGQLSASSPAVTRTRSMSRSSRAATPATRAGSSRSTRATGAIRWRRALPSPSESSPLLDHGSVCSSARRTAPCTRSTPATAAWSGPTTPAAR